MSYLVIDDITTYTPPVNTVVIYNAAEEGQDPSYKVKNRAGATSALNAKYLPLLGVETTDVPALVFAADYEAVVAKDVIDVSNVTVAMNARASVSYVKEVANRKVDKTDFLSAYSVISDELDSINVTLDSKLDASVIADYSTTAQVEGLIGSTVSTALADYSTTSEVETMIGSTVSTALADYSTTTEVEGLIGSTVSTALADYSTTTEVQGFIGSTVSAALANYSTTTDVQSMIGSTVSTALADYSTTVEVQGMIDTAASRVFRYKTTVATVADLANVENPQIGDVYHVTAADAEYVCVGTTGTLEENWEELGSAIDLSGYYTKEEVNAITINGETIGSDRAIDVNASMIKLAGETTTVAESLSGLDTRLGTAEGNITGLGTRLGTAEGNITTIMGDTATSGSIKAAVYAEEQRAVAAEGALGERIDSLTINGLTFSNDAITVGADDIALTGYTAAAGSTLSISADNSVLDAVSAIDSQIAIIRGDTATTGSIAKAVADEAAARAQAISGEASARGEADTALANRISGLAINGNTFTNDALTLGGNSIALAGYTAGSDDVVDLAANTTVTAAFEAVVAEMNVIASATGADTSAIEDLQANKADLVVTPVVFAANNAVVIGGIVQDGVSSNGYSLKNTEHYVVKSNFTGNLPAAPADGYKVTFTVVNGGSAELIVPASGDTILGGTANCAIGVSGDGLVINNETYTFMYIAADSNWILL